MLNVLLAVWLSMLGGCQLLWPEAMAPVYRAEGTWHGSVQPVTITWTGGQRQTTGVFFTINDGPIARASSNGKSSTHRMIGRNVLLVTKDGRIVPWSAGFAGREAEVTGAWDSRNQGIELPPGTSMLQNGERATYSLLKVSGIEWPRPSTKP
jgi:hypothetical protein